MSDYFEFVGPLTRFTLARAEVVNALFQQISDSFGKLPDEELIKEGRTIYGSATGTNAYEVTLPFPPETMVEGMTFRFMVPNTNTGACTVDIGPGPVAMVRPNGGALVANDLSAGQIVQATWNGTNVRVVGFLGSDLAAAAASAAAAAASEAATAPVIPYLDEIAAVEAEIAAVVAVANNLPDITAVAGFLAEISTVAGLEAEIAALGPISDDITTVADNIADVITAAGTVTAAGLAADIETLADVAADIATLGPISADITTVAGIEAEVVIVATNVADVTNFSDVYLGPRAVEPTTRTDLSPLVEGDMYFDTDVGAVRFWDGDEWVSTSGVGLLQAANNLDDLADLPTAITNLGLDDVVRESLTLTAGTGLTGGGDLSANRSVALSAGSIASLVLADSSVQPARTLTAGDGLSGGGDLSANRSFAVDGTVVRTSRAVNTGTGLTGGGNLSANRTISLTNHSADLLTSGTVPNTRLSGDYSFENLTLSGGANVTGTIQSDGIVRAAGSLAAGGFRNGVGDQETVVGNQGVFARQGGTIILRPNGAADSTNQATLTTAGTFSAVAFSGSGASLTDLPAANIVGTIPIVAGTSGTLSIARGGTGATSAAAARTALGTNDAANLTTGVLANDRVAQGNVTQHQGALSIAGSQLTGSIANALLDQNYTNMQNINSTTGSIGGSSGINFRPNGSGSPTNQMTLATNGNLTVAGNITANSDERLKADIEPIHDAMALIRRIEGVRYTRRATGRREIGVVAQNMRAVAPELVFEGEDGMLSVAQGNAIGLLIEGMKELDARLTGLAA